jgi:hypothetical protein
LGAWAADDDFAAPAAGRGAAEADGAAAAAGEDAGAAAVGSVAVSTGVASEAAAGSLAGAASGADAATDPEDAAESVDCASPPRASRWAELPPQAAARSTEMDVAAKNGRERNTSPPWQFGPTALRRAA